MFIGNNFQVNSNLKLNGKIIERIQSIKYLGTIIDESATNRIELRSRIEQARAVFRKMSNLFCKNDIQVNNY